MQYQIEAADATTGRELTITVDAPDAREAEAVARRRGLLVAAISALRDRSVPLVEYQAAETRPAPSLPTVALALVAGAEVASLSLMYFGGVEVTPLLAALSFLFTALFTALAVVSRRKPLNMVKGGLSIYVGLSVMGLSSALRLVGDDPVIAIALVVKLVLVGVLIAGVQSAKRFEQTQRYGK